MTINGTQKNDYHKGQFHIQNSQFLATLHPNQNNFSPNPTVMPNFKNNIANGVQTADDVGENTRNIVNKY